MMKSLALNTVILYILFKTPVSEHVLAKLPSYVRSLKSFKELYEQLTGLIWRGSKMSKRVYILVLFVAGIWLLKKIWEHLQGYQAVASFVEKYLCDRKVASFSSEMRGTSTDLEGKRFFMFSEVGAKRSLRQDQ